MAVSRSEGKRGGCALLPTFVIASYTETHPTRYGLRRIRVRFAAERSPKPPMSASHSVSFISSLAPRIQYLSPALNIETNNFRRDELEDTAIKIIILPLLQLQFLHTKNKTSNDGLPSCAALS